MAKPDADWAEAGPVISPAQASASAHAPKGDFAIRGGVSRFIGGFIPPRVYRSNETPTAAIPRERAGSRRSGAGPSGSRSRRQHVPQDSARS